jgi:cytochrome d ubiquinol oxidase subunit I
VLIPLQIVAGDLHGLNTLQHQPQKIAAMEGIWHTERGAPLLLFAVPDEKTRSNHFEIGIPRSWRRADPQARRRRRDPRPERLQGRRSPAGGAAVLRLPHHGRHGAADAGLQLGSGCGSIAARLGGASAAAAAAVGLAGMSFSGWVATVAGWYVTEIGRQPFIVFGLLRVDDVASSRAGTDDRADAGAVRHRVPGADRGLCRRRQVHGREAEAPDARGRRSRRCRPGIPPHELRSFDQACPSSSWR